MARPSKYEPEFVDKVYELARTGLTDKEIAKAFKIGEATLNRWKKEFREFRESLQKGKQDFDSDEIESALRARALGYTHDDEKIFTHVIKDKVKVTKVKTYRHYPPDVGAINTWLNNRRPDRWKQKQEVTGSDGGPIIIQITEKESKL